MAEDVKVILVVDDSRTARLMIRSIIRHLHPNWIVLEADGGAKALEIVERDTPNCITMDVNMPGMDGIEAARTILGKYPGTRIVLFTANLQESTRQEAQAMGMAFVAKPVTEQSVTQALSVLGEC
jgi:CheY-like chemotaxis protein